MQLTFLGATGTVTGSRYLLEVDDKRILIDCGLFQGYEELRLHNWSSFPVDPASIDAVILTHAHIDHSGYLPLLVKNGFKGKIYCTPGTAALCELLLPDSGYLQEEEAMRANKYHYSKHNPALPLYTIEDAQKALKHFKQIDFLHPVFFNEKVSFTFHHAGHIIGAATVIIKIGNKRILFTGDLGRPNDILMNPPENIEYADYLIIEGTYGNRLHSALSPDEHLGKIIRETAKRGGTVIIPSFAVGRAQSILLCLYRLKKSNAIPAHLPIYLDSPMAISATDILKTFQHETRLTEQEALEVCNIATYVNTSQESKTIDNHHMPSIIISASGMVTGGRVLHHIKAFSGDPKNTIAFCGYQAGGTRGARMMAGEREVKMLGLMVPINAHIEMIDNLSAHVDYEEMIDWLAHFRKPPIHLFITHGELDAAENLKLLIEQKFKWNTTIPAYLQKFNL